MSEILYTERLALRPPEARDAPSLTVLCGEFDVSKNTSSMPYPYYRSDAENFIAKATKERAAGDGYAYVIARKPGYFCMGVIGLHSRGAAFELGYCLGKPYWGKGYATEAALAIVAFGFETLMLETIMAGYFSDNPASGRVLGKAGFEPTGEREEKFSKARGCAVPCIGQRLTRARFEERRQ